jgi:hypothetical protein
LYPYGATGGTIYTSIGNGNIGSTPPSANWTTGSACNMTKVGNLGGNTYRNNIFVNNNGGTANYSPVNFRMCTIASTMAGTCILDTSETTLATSVFTNNIFWSTGGGLSGAISTGPTPSYGYTHHTCAELTSLTTISGCINSDPKFVSADPSNFWNNPSQFNLTPQPTSPAISAGTSVGVSTYDIVGNTWNNPPSIGAYEYGSIGVLSSAKAITVFNFNGLTPAVVGTIDETGKTIALTVPYGNAVTAIVPTITITGSSVSPTSGVAANFTTSQTYTVTAANASTQPYIVTVTIAPIGTHTIIASSGSNGSITPSGSVSVNNGADQAFTITPNSGYHIDTVTADGSSVSATSPYTFTNVTADHTISATFAADAVVVSSGGGGGGGGGYVAPNVNITNFQSLPLYSAIKLTWTNPTDPSFLRALIVRSGTSTPATASSGTLVYQGLSTSFTDTNLLNNQIYYYSAFPYLTTGTSTPARASISGTPTGVTTTPTITTQTSNTIVTPTTTAGSGTFITTSLLLGSTGSQVLALQQFLIDNGYLSLTTPTTYFGSLTQTALQKFQCDHSIVCSGSPTSTGYGGTGPKTRAAINTILSGGESNSSNSTTSDDAHIATLRALIASLLQQVAVLQARLAALNTPVQTLTLPTTSTATETIFQPLTNTFTFTRYLSLGMSGHDVEELQFFLNTRGFTIASSGPGSRGEETSYFGTSTKRALTAYQDRRYIVIDDAGYFGEHTREAVNGEMGR